MILKALAPAKLNLSLDIVGTLPGGYHALDSVMLAVDLCDTLTFERGGAGVRFSCSDPALPTDEGNLVLLAVRAFFAHTGTGHGGLEITLTKRIPLQAGLAGGSADAAAALVALRRLYKASLSDADLREIALTLGSDIPFCLMGGCARAGGRGELVSPLPPLPVCAVFVIAKPAVGMDTRRAFEIYDQSPPTPPRTCTDTMVSALDCGDLKAIGPAMSNVFEDVLPLPEVRRLKAAILAHGGLGAVMTGSGTAVAGLFDNERAAGICLESLRGSAPFVCLARPASSGPVLV